MAMMSVSSLSFSTHLQRASVVSQRTSDGHSNNVDGPSIVALLVESGMETPVVNNGHLFNDVVQIYYRWDHARAPSESL
jgi:hypothetical protein